MIKDDLQTKVVEQAALIAAVLKKGKDVEPMLSAYPEQNEAFKEYIKKQ